MSENQMNNVITVDRIIAVNCYDFAPKFALPEDCHDSWEFVYVDSGEVTYTVGERSIRCKSGDMIFHPPGTVHSILCDGKRSSSIFNVIFDTSSEAMWQFAGRTVSVPLELSNLLKELIGECNRSFFICNYPLQLNQNAPLGGEQLARLYIEMLLIRLLRHIGTDDDERAPVDPYNGVNSDLVERMCAYLRANLERKLTLGDLTEEFHFGKSYLCEQFKKVTGMSVMNCLLEMKLTEAKRLLREESIPIHEIAEGLGFESPEYFSRYFRKRVGHSPKEFRRMLINDSSLHFRE